MIKKQARYVFFLINYTQNKGNHTCVYAYDNRRLSLQTRFVRIYIGSFLIPTKFNMQNS